MRLFQSLSLVINPTLQSRVQAWRKFIRNDIVANTVPMHMAVKWRVDRIECAGSERNAEIKLSISIKGAKSFEIVVFSGLETIIPAPPESSDVISAQFQVSDAVDALALMKYLTE